LNKLLFNATSAEDCILKDGNGNEIHMDVISSEPHMSGFGPFERCTAIRLECRVKDPLVSSKSGKNRIPKFLRHTRVIYNYPATIVYWEDGTRTVVKCDERDRYDPQYGVALCFIKKALGNNSRALNDVLKELMSD